MSAQVSPHSLEVHLGYVFRRGSLLTQALTHSTFANENPDGGPANERLEFLGDAVVDLVAAEILFRTFPEASEGELTRRRARVVNQSGLARLARALDLGQHLRVGRGPGGGAARNLTSSILADAFEAVVGALFLDGGYAAVDACIGPLVERSVIDHGLKPADFKTALQEACHRLGHGPPEYRVVSVDGPDHARRYTCQLWLDGQSWAEGEGSNKKAAEQQCAQSVLARLSEKQRA